MEGDPFETVAIAYNPPQAAVLTSLFGWYGIPVFATNLDTIRTNPQLTLALGGIEIRVLRDDAAEARAIVIEAAEQEDEAPRTPDPLEQRILMTLFYAVTGLTPPPRRSAVVIGG